MAGREGKTPERPRVPEPSAASTRQEAAAVPERRVLELQRSIGNRATALLLRVPEVADRPRAQAPPVQPAQQVQPRRDYVFIMGDLESRRARNQFYRSALRFWRAHCPNATFVLDRRTMRSLLDWIRANVNEPIGRLIIVTHANEDGTLSFGLDSDDPNRRLDVNELRNALHPPGGGASMLPSVSDLVDAQTRVHIKGCDIGRTQQMVELIDEAFGGQVTVTAPTHEQEYGYDPALAGPAIEAARAEVEARHPLPPAVDPALRGRARRTATQARQRALRERSRAIQAELSEIGERAGTYEAFSGPMFQRPGTELFREEEVRAEVDRLYGHLSEAQRERLAERLVAADRRRAAVAQRQGTYEQQGQRAYRYTPFRFRFNEPRTVAQVVALHGAQFRRERFAPTTVRTTRVNVEGGFTIRTEVDGTVTQGRGRSRTTSRTTFTFTTQDPVPDDATVLREGRGQIPNPDRYRWQVQETRSGARVTRTAVAERVVAYLHHGELDPRPHEHFTRPLGDPNFFATSTFRPPRRRP